MQVLIDIYKFLYDHTIGGAGYAAFFLLLGRVIFTTEVHRKAFRYFRYGLLILISIGLVFLISSLIFETERHARIWDTGNPYFVLLMIMLFLNFVLPAILFIPKTGKWVVLLVCMAVSMNAIRITEHWVIATTSIHLDGFSESWTYFFTSINLFTIVEGLVMALIVLLISHALTPNLEEDTDILV
ncbi:hypothetical protein JYT72_02000 [Crocinitomix catalasitica]|nr:hypothetical protein [Crocinitomix catalasitica]